MITNESILENDTTHDGNYFNFLLFIIIPFHKV
jgi:hypothetical protein